MERRTELTERSNQLATVGENHVAEIEEVDEWRVGSHCFISGNPVAGSGGVQRGLRLASRTPVLVANL